jgi:hypothetical protein
MNIYLSKSSVFVKIATIGTMIILIIAAFTLITTNKQYGLVGGIVFCVLILGSAIYFYANSLD